MYRKKAEELIRWKNDPYRKPLLIYGGRQVGKTYLVRDIFAKENYQKVLYIDLAEDASARRFIKNHVNAGEIIQYLSIQKNTIIDSDTLLIFDEIQEFMPLITALKYFCQDYREIPVIATGSMVRIRLKQIEDGAIRKDPEIQEDTVFLFPVGKVDEIDLYPMTFSEFLFVRNTAFYNFLQTSWKERKEINQEYHDLGMKYFFEYMLIGGMPEAVDIFIQTGSYQRALMTLRNIYSNYLNDMSLYQISSESLLRTRRVYENVYAQLSKKNKNFKISLIEKGKRFRDYYNPLDWLREARVIYPSYQLKEHVTLPLKEDEESLFRIYLADCGLFCLQSGISPQTFLENNLANNTLSGIFFENYVADELAAHGIKLFYWKGKTSSELEFIIEHNGEIIPVDAKKNKGSLSSLNKYRENNAYGISVKISQNHYGYSEQNHLLTIPYYYVSFWLDELTESSEQQS